MEFLGYRRADGRFGVRNHVVVMSSVACANPVVARIGAAVPEVKTITHTEGCGRGIRDVEIAWRTLAGLGKNPNVAAVLVVGLGCEVVNGRDLCASIAKCGKPAESLLIQDAGGTRKAVQAGTEIARRLVEATRDQPREPASFEHLIVGLECGASDALSGVTANPVVGRVADWLVDGGATVILAETTEMIGAEHVLERRAASPEIGRSICDLVAGQRQLAREILGDFADSVISPGNASGGLTTIAEKSLGCIAKAGRSPIQEVLPYGGAPTARGLVIMDTPGADVFQLTGMAAGGATITIFTTGLGTTIGFPVMPVIKVASNSPMFERLEDDMDLNAGVVADGASVDEVGKRLADLVQRVADGHQPRAEANGQDVLAIHTLGPAF